MSYDYEKAQRNHVYQSQAFNCLEDADREMFLSLTDKELDFLAEHLWNASSAGRYSSMNVRSPISYECAYLARVANELYEERTGEKVNLF